jgi:carboxylesterase type B
VPDGGYRNLPVLLFTPGGGFLLGASYLYDMLPLVNRGLARNKPFIGVTINYRLGPLGFLNPDPSDKMFNLGLQNQVAALH